MFPISRLARIYIEVEHVEETWSTLRLVDLDTEDVTRIESRFGYESLRDFRSHFDTELLEFKRRADSATKSGDFGQLSRAFEVFDKIGTNLFYKLFETDMEKVTYFFEQFLLRGIGGRIPSGVMWVEIPFKYPVPYEFVIIPGARGEPEPTVSDPLGVTQFASRVLGYSFIVVRVLTEVPKRYKAELWGKPAVPLKYFRNPRVNVKQEEDFFATHKDSFEVEEPWPREGSIKDLSAELMKHLRYPYIGFDGRPKPEGSLEDQIHHFTCHCYIDEMSSLRHSLGLIGSSKSSGIKISDLIYHLTKSCNKDRDQPNVDNYERPLVFLNACGSSKMLPASAASFPTFFLYDNKNCGFIGVETNVPEQTAIEFSRIFYTHLADGRTLGEAIYLSKWAMLQSDENPSPLGILYTSYARPEMRIVRK
jgi:hypothetical protein